MNFATTWKARNFTNFISYRTNSGMDRSKPLILYLIMHEKFIGCVLGQRGKTRRKEQAI